MKDFCLHITAMTNEYVRYLWRERAAPYLKMRIPLNNWKGVRALSLSLSLCTILSQLKVHGIDSFFAGHVCLYLSVFVQVVK